MNFEIILSEYLIEEKNTQLVKKITGFINLVLDNADNQYARLNRKEIALEPASNMIYAMEQLNSRMKKAKIKPNMDAIKLNASETKEKLAENFMKGFCDTFLGKLTDGNIEKAEAVIDKYTEELEARKELESNINALGAIIKNKKLSNDEIYFYMRGFDEALKGNPGAAAAFPPIGQDIDTQEKAERWFGDLAHNVSRLTQGTGTLNIALKDMLKAGATMVERGKIVDAIADLQKAAKGDSNKHLGEIYILGSRMEQELSGERLSPKVEVFNQNAVKILDHANKFLTDMDTKKTNHDWDSKTAKKIGAAIDVICAIDPDPDNKKKELLYKYDVRITKEGYVPLGPEGMFNRIDEYAKNMLKLVNDADPTLMKSSRQFKEFKEAAEKIAKKASQGRKDFKKIKDPDDVDNAVYNFKNEMFGLVNTLMDKSQKYVDYKTAALDNKKANSTETKRIKAALSSKDTSKKIKDALRLYTIHCDKENGPVAMVNCVILEVPNMKETPDKQYASLLYLATLKESVQADKNIKDVEVEKFLEQDSIDVQVKELMKDPAFTMALKEIKEDKADTAIMKANKIKVAYNSCKTKLEKSNVNEQNKQNQNPVKPEAQAANLGNKMI